jgi:ABC-type transport system involved in multi-copper enzyme maturation permease subunit
MIWTAWRQQRSLVIAMTIVAIALMAYALFTGLHEQGLWHHLLTKPCKGSFHTPGRYQTYCNQLLRTVENAGQFNRYFATIAVAMGPLFGAILGVNAVTREVEHRTTRLVWTQSGSRSQWLASKYVVNTAILVVIFVPMSLLLAWWNGAAHYGARIMPSSFPISGFLLLLYAVFAFALVVTLGLFIRRAGWTIAVGLVVVGVVFFTAEFGIQPHLMTPAFTTDSSTLIEQGSTSGYYSSGGAPSNAWSRQQGYVPNGTKKTPSAAELTFFGNKFQRCMTPTRSRPTVGYSYCLHHLGLTSVQLYVPNSDFWTMQLLVGSIYFAAAMLLTGVSFATVRRMQA